MSDSSPRLGVRLTPNTPLRDQAYASLKDALLSGKLRPGDRLVEQEIANSLGLSRSPVREAFRRLEQEGFLQVTRSGIIVQELSAKDIEDLYFLRQRLEGIAAALAAKCATEADIVRLNDAFPAMEEAVQQENTDQVMRVVQEFHAVLYALAENKYLFEVLTSLYDQVRRFSALNMKVRHRGQAVIEEHRLIVRAIAQHDAVAAERFAQEHVQHAWEHARKSLPVSQGK